MKFTPGYISWNKGKKGPPPWNTEMKNYEARLQAMFQNVEREYREEIVCMTIFKMGVRTGSNGKPEGILIEEIPFERRLRASRKFEPRIDRLRRLIAERPWCRVVPNTPEIARTSAGDVGARPYRLLCFLGFHKWGESLSTWLRPDEIFLSTKRCRRCGKIKEYAFDRQTGREFRLPCSADEMEDFYPTWQKILARRKK